MCGERDIIGTIDFVASFTSRLLVPASLATIPTMPLRQMCASHSILGRQSGTRAILDLLHAEGGGRRQWHVLGKEEHVQHRQWCGGRLLSTLSINIKIIHLLANFLAPDTHSSSARTRIATQARRPSQAQIIAISQMAVVCARQYNGTAYALLT